MREQRKPRFISELLISVLADVGFVILKRVWRWLIVHLRRVLCPKLREMVKEYEDEEAEYYRRIPDEDLFN